MNRVDNNTDCLRIRLASSSSGGDAGRYIFFAPEALEQFNRASQSLNELIERNWNYFERADERYGVLCADLYREATRPAIP